MGYPDAIHFVLKAPEDGTIRTIFCVRAKVERNGHLQSTARGHVVGLPHESSTAQRKDIPTVLAISSEGQRMEYPDAI